MRTSPTANFIASGLVPDVSNSRYRTVIVVETLRPRLLFMNRVNEQCFQFNNVSDFYLFGSYDMHEISLKGAKDSRVNIGDSLQYCK